jgi:signal transduction histidine kinase
MKYTEENNSRISISFEVIRYITLYYFSVAIILTIGQVIFEYNDIKTNISTSIHELSKSFNNSLTNSLWEFNDNQTKTILAGILESPSVLGVKLVDANNKLLHKLGEVSDKEFKPSSNVLLKYISPNEYFMFKKKLIKKLDNGQFEIVGFLYIYSGNKIILEQLSRIIFYIIVNSILKTISLWAILIIFFNTRVKKPLQNLVNKIKSLDPQNPEQIVVEESSDTEELYQIVQSFNNLIRELKNFKEILEAIVDNKTELLKEKNIEVRNLINKLEQAQNQIINQEKLNSLGLVSAGIAHELKNPLNISKNSSIVLKDILSINNSEESYNPKEIDLNKLQRAPAIIEMLLHSNQRMETIIKNMLLQSRTEYTKPADVNLFSFINMNLRVVQKSLKTDASNTAKIIVDIDEDINLKVFPNELGRLLVNLYENSFFALGEKLNKMQTSKTEFTPELRTSVKKFGKNKILFTVHDNGIGIPNNVKDKILEPFFTTKPTGLGTGLGLYLSYEIIKKHHGEITINSEVNVYTEIQIILPTDLDKYYSLN